MRVLHLIIPTFLGVIQIIRDTTLGGGTGVIEVSHTLFLLFKTLFLILLEGKLCVTKQDKASKDTFFLVLLIFQSNLSRKISHQKQVPKKCHVLFEWPLIKNIDGTN
jgi:hypothetical protein